ncbi:hypothetical protein [Clostridium lundense]|uniref:hypothetical protein n=1 Tax=Clostridium lundense TaxID=319475 RepID=UPI000481905A|nr:hypothetical protein [Clostridium lundense]
MDYELFHLVLFDIKKYIIFSNIIHSVRIINPEERLYLSGIILIGISITTKKIITVIILNLRIDLFSLLISIIKYDIQKNKNIIHMFKGEPTANLIFLVISEILKIPITNNKK